MNTYQAGVYRVLTMGALATLLLSACGDSSTPAETASSAPPPQAQVATDSAPVPPAKPDYSGEWWFKTFGDESVLLAESGLAMSLSADALGRDERLMAEFKATQGSAYLNVTLNSAAGDQQEQLEISGEDYLALWEGVMDSGFLAAAMAGENTGWGSGVGTLLHGSAGEQGLGWTITSTYEGMQSAAETRKLMEVLEAAASAHSALYREQR